MKRPPPTNENEDPPKRKSKKTFKVYVPCGDGAFRIYDHGGEEELIQFILNLEEDLGITDVRFYNEGKIILLEEKQKDVWELENIDIYIDSRPFLIEVKESEHCNLITLLPTDEQVSFILLLTRRKSYHLQIMKKILILRMKYIMTTSKNFTQKVYIFLKQEKRPKK